MPEVVFKRFLVGFIGIILLLFQPVRAQKEGAVWYFGNKAGLDFNRQYPTPLTNGQIDTREGVATICDKDGNLLFYTDGQRVFDRTHNIMNNGEGLLGNVSSTQSSIVVPKPGSTTQYFVFTVDQAGTPSNPGNGLNYSIIDMALNGGMGSVTIIKNQPLPKVQGVLFTEKITVVKHSDKKSYWIIAHEFGTWEFYEFLLDETGLTLYNQVGAGTEHKFDPNDRDNRGATGYLKSSPKGDFLATAIEGLHFFELFSFDNRNGNIQVIAKLPAGDGHDPFSFTGAAYGIEFSPTSNFLYGSTRKGGLVYQWNLNQLNETAILNSVKIIRNQPGTLCGALQLAYNGKIYLSLGGQPYLGVINSPIQEQCNYAEHGASLIDTTGLGGKAYFGLPTFLSDFFKAAEFYFENTCFRDKTIFYPSTRIGVDAPPVWTIWKNNAYVGEAVTDPITWQGVFTFPAPGDYVVKMRIQQFGSTFDFQRDITIHQLPDLDLPDTTSLCKGSAARLDAGVGAFYSWVDAPNLNVERYRNIYNPGQYIVTVTHYNGCSNTDTTLIVSKPLPVIQDTVVTFAACGSSNGSIKLVMEEAPDQYEFNWTDFPSNSTSEAYNLPGGVYEVKITSVITGCSLTSKISISEENAPDVVIQSSTTGAVCPGTRVTLTAQGAVNYLWENPAGITTDTVSIYPWKTDTYIVKGFSVDQGSGKECFSYNRITITVLPYNLPQLGADRIGCKGDTIKLDGGSAFQSWRWSNNETTRIVFITESIDSLVVYVTDNNHCTLTDTTKVTIKPLPDINLPGDIVQCKAGPISLSGGMGESWLWSTGETTPEIFVNESGTYKLTIAKNGCTNTDSVSVTIKPLPKPALNLPRDTSICLKDSIRLYELNNEWGVTYLWSTGKTDRYIFVSQPDIYWLKTTLDGCENSDTVNLIIKPLPVVDLGRDTVYCKSNPIQLNGGTGDLYLWSTGANTSQITINETGDYSLTITKDGCPNSDTVSIRINDPSLLAIDSVDSSPVTCPGNRDGSLRIYSHGSGTSFEYSIDDGLNYFTSPWFQGLYGDNQFQIVVREDKACTTKYFKEITFKEPDSIKINYHLVSPSCETCPDGEINLLVSGGTPPYSVLWSTNDTITHLSNMALGNYLVWVTDASDCHANALINLTLDYPPFQIPNAFTPNGDGVNEKWEIDALRDFPECNVKIFNRSGRLVWWSDTGYPIPWDGIDKSGNVLPIGSYYYLVWLQSDLKPLKGSVSILR
jgi:gliding motility-associated-like protein